MEVLYYFKQFDKEKILSPHRILSPDAPPLSYRDAHLRVSVAQWFYSSRELRIFSMSRARSKTSFKLACYRLYTRKYSQKQMISQLFFHEI